MKYLLLLAFLSYCSYNYGQSTQSKDHFVILPYDKEAYTSLPKNSISDTLIDTDFVTIDNLLTICIDKYNQEQTIEYKKMTNKFPNDGFKLKNFVIDLKRYYRQYIVIQNAKGEKEVWVNCFCSIQYMDYWRKTIVRVMDSGNCFFNLRINLTKKSFKDFIVNGEA